MKDKIIELLGAGITPVQAALACGVTESYISQLLAQEDVQQVVREMRVKRAAQYVEHDDAIDTDEEAARKLVRKNINNGFLKPMEALKHFQVLNAARRKGDGTGAAQVPTSTIVNLNLPAVTSVQFKLTPDKQVIEVDGRSMTTMPASTVNRLLREKKAAEILSDTVNLPKMKIDTPALIDTI